LEWEPNQRDAWVADAQRWICQINGVLQCKIDVDGDGAISAVHVVAGVERDPRHLVRDVEGLLKARLDIDVYYKKIGVVQVLENVAGPEVQDAVEPRTLATGGADAANTANAGESEEILESTALPEAIPAVLVMEEQNTRVVCGGVSLMASDAVVRAEVLLSVGELEVRGLREGANHVDSDIQLVARAAVAAVTELITDPVVMHLREVRLLEVGGQRVVVVAVDLVEGRQSTTLYGTCGTAHNQQQAVVYAVLDAVNRRIALLALKASAAVE